MKGQIFIVSAIIVAVLLLALAINIKPVYTSTDYLQNYFTNVRTEIIDTFESALLSGEDYTNVLDEYVAFSEDVLSNKGIEQQITYYENSSGVVVDIYLERGEEYYSDQIIIPLGVYS